MRMFQVTKEDNGEATKRIASNINKHPHIFIDQDLDLTNQDSLGTDTQISQRQRPSAQRKTE